MACSFVGTELLIPLLFLPPRTTVRPVGWPLVGREVEFRRVSERLSPGSGVLIVGEPGVGKTRLARTGIEAAYARGARTEWIAGAAGSSGVPLAAVAHVLPEHTDDEGEPTRLMRSAARVLASRPHEPLVIGLDDSHLIDAASAAVVHAAVVNGGASLVATVRRGEALPEPVEVLLRDGQLERMDLNPLSDDEVATLLVKALDGAVETGTIERLCAAGQGNPMLVRELVHGGLESGALAQSEGMWIWNGPFTATRLRDLVEGRLRRLTRSERSGVELIAAGAPLTVDVAESLLGPGVIEELDRAGLLLSRRGGDRTYLGLAHPLYGEVLRATISPLRRRAICKQLADAFSLNAAHSSNDILRVVAWRLEAGEPNDLSHLRQAARRALGASDFELAERVAWEGVDRWNDDESRMLLGFAMAGQGRIDDAQSVLASASKPRGDLINRALDTFFYGSRTTSAATAVNRLQELIGGVDDWPEGTEPFVEAARAGVLVLSGDVLDAWSVADRVIERGSAPPSVELRCLIIAATMAAMAGRADESLSYADRGMALIEWSGNTTSPATDALVELDIEPLMVAVRSLAQRIAGRLTVAQEIAGTGYHRYLVENNGPARGLFALAAGQVELAAGRISDAHNHLREAVALLRRPPALYLVWALGCLAQTSALLGDLDTATNALSEADSQRDPNFQVFDCDVRQGEAWTAAARGDTGTAREIALDAATRSASAGQVGFAASAAVDAGRLGSPANASLILNDLERRSDSLAVRAFGRYTRALDDRDPIALLGIGEELKALGFRLLSAEAFAEAAYELERGGSKAKSRRAAADASGLLTECGPVRTPSIARLTRTPELTDREEEIARLAIAGLANREIAARLHVSVRTVDNHLHHVYEKLGIARREELSSVLR